MTPGGTVGELVKSKEVREISGVVRSERGEERGPAHPFPGTHRSDKKATMCSREGEGEGEGGGYERTSREVKGRR
eukprot:768737-Hanusia_phi.AAC.12